MKPMNGKSHVRTVW